jgi:hypothetical protein
MVSCHLSVSLQRLFNEFNALWPNRNHGIDGWCRDPSSGRSLGHNPGHNGLVHAIDVDVRGIWPPYVIDHINHRNDVLWYIIWNRTLWTNTGGWHATAYTPANAVPPYNPHTDHMHIEIYQTAAAESFTGSWGLSSTSSGFGEAPPSSEVGAAPGFSQGFGARDDRDVRDAMSAMAFQGNAAVGNIQGYTGVIAALRR